MNYLGKYNGTNVYAMQFDEYYNLYQRGQIDPGTYYVIIDDGYKMIQSGEVVGRVEGTDVIPRRTTERYQKVFEKLQQDIYKNYKTIGGNEVKKEDKVVEKKDKEIEKVEVKEIIFTDYSGVVDKFFEDLKNIKYDV